MTLGAREKEPSMTDEPKDHVENNPKKPAKTEDMERMFEILSHRTAYHMEIPFAFRDPPSYQRFSLYQLIYSLAGLVLGLVCVLGGVVLFLNGVVGSTSWTAKMLGAESKVSDAAPGAVLFIVGLFVVFVTRFSIKVKK
jgi:hypothetical protein